MNEARALIHTRVGWCLFWYFGQGPTLQQEEEERVFWEDNIGQAKRWAEIDMTRLGMLLAQALKNLERGEHGDVDVDLAGRWIRLVNDPINGRVVIFELPNSMEQRKWHWQGSVRVPARVE